MTEKFDDSNTETQTVFFQADADSKLLRPKIDSQQLFATHNEILIEHQGDEYRLRITSNNKLILTK